MANNLLSGKAARGIKLTVKSGRARWANKKRFLCGKSGTQDLCEAKDTIARIDAIEARDGAGSHAYTDE
jgi:hypothetical protein